MYYSNNCHNLWLVKDLTVINSCLYNSCYRFICYRQEYGNSVCPCTDITGILTLEAVFVHPVDPIFLIIYLYQSWLSPVLIIFSSCLDRINDVVIYHVNSSNKLMFGKIANRRRNKLIHPFYFFHIDTPKSTGRKR